MGCEGSKQIGHSVLGNENTAADGPEENVVQVVIGEMGYENDKNTIDFDDALGPEETSNMISKYVSD